MAPTLSSQGVFYVRRFSVCIYARGRKTFLCLSCALKWFKWSDRNLKYRSCLCSDSYIGPSSSAVNGKFILASQLVHNPLGLNYYCASVLKVCWFASGPLCAKVGACHCCSRVVIVKDITQSIELNCAEGVHGDPPLLRIVELTVRFRGLWARHIDHIHKHQCEFPGSCEQLVWKA